MKLAMMDSISSRTDKKASSKIPLRGVVKALLRAPWREEDMFQVPLLLHTILVVDRERSVLNRDMDEELSHRVRLLSFLFGHWAYDIITFRHRCHSQYRMI